MLTEWFSNPRLSINEYYTRAEYKEGVKSILAAISKCMIDEGRIDLATSEGPNATVIFEHIKQSNQYKIQIIPHVSGGSFKSMPIYDRWLYYAMLDLYKSLKNEYIPLKEKSMEDVLSCLNRVKDPEYLAKKDKSSQLNLEKETPPTLSSCDGSLITTTVDFSNNGSSAVFGMSAINTIGLEITSRSNLDITSSSNLPLDEQKEMQENVRKTAAAVSDIRKHMVSLNKTSARSCVQRPFSFRRRMFK